MDPIYKALYIAQGDPEEACLINPKYTLDQYVDTSTSPGYSDFLASMQKRFIAHLDTTLIYQQYEAFKMLEEIKASKDYKYLKDASKHFTDILKLTAPIVERLGKQAREEERLSGLRLVIQAPPQSGENK